MLTGRSGADNFVFAAYAQTGNDAVTRDRITDFGHTDLDRIDLSGIDLSGIDADGSFGNGKTAFHFIGNTVFHHVAGELRYVKFNPPGTAQDVTVVAGDIDGNGTTEFQIDLDGLVNLTAGDFIRV